MEKKNFGNDSDSENDEYILEGNCGDSVEIENNIEQQLLEKAKKAICKIISTINNKNEIGTGFFCKIHYNNNKNIIKVLFTNNHILNEESLKVGKIINIIYQGKAKDIKITNDRLYFTDSRDYKKGLDYSCIEIFDSDEIEDFYEIYIDNLSNNEIVSINGYFNGKELNVQSGHLKEIKNYKIYHSVHTEHGCSGSPIILTYRNFNIIGIHRCFIKEKQLNLGSYIIDVLKHINEEKYKGKKK